MNGQVALRLAKHPVHVSPITVHDLITCRACSSTYFAREDYARSRQHFRRHDLNLLRSAFYPSCADYPACFPATRLIWFARLWYLPLA